MTMVGQGNAGWRADPFGRHEVRLWDGTRWTAYVKDGETNSLDQPTGVTPGSTTAETAAAIAPEVSTQAPSILTADVLVVEQHLQVMDVANDYDVFGADGERLASVREVIQSSGKRALRAVSSYEQFRSHRLEVTDHQGELVLAVTRPAQSLRSPIVVTSSAGLELGRVVQRRVLGKISFSLQAPDGGYVGTLQAESWVAWNFRLEDNTGRLVASITKNWDGLARERFRTSDAYVVRVNHPVTEPLRSLAVAAALAVDTALKQDARGLS